MAADELPTELWLSDTGTDRVEDIRPGTVRYLDSGEQVNFGQPTKASATRPVPRVELSASCRGDELPV
jgi:hypothetical protein